MNDVKVPDNLKETYTMLTSAFPNGIDSDNYSPILSILYEEMSDRNIATVISLFTGKEYGKVLNDIYSVASGLNKVDKQAVINIKQYLLSFGYEKWLNSD